MRKTLRAASVAATVLLSISLSACATAPGVSVKDPSPTPTSEATFDVAPLTGVEYKQGENTFLAGPVVMSKIDNSFEARPHEGLSQTDIVYEELVEGGITRFLAVWHSQLPKQIGPVRSIRPMDPDIASPFGGILAYSGGQTRFVKKMRATKVYNASETSEQSKKTMIRVSDRVAPHNLFLLPQKIQSQHLKLAAPALWQQFTKDEAKVSTVEGKAATTVTARFPRTKAVWTYDEATKLYARSQDGTKQIDKANNVAETAVNLILIYVDIDRSEPDPIYGNVPRTVVNGTGTGYYVHAGKVIDIKWSKKDRVAPQVFTDVNGEKITMAAGNTWVELVPTDAGAKVILK